MPVNDKPRGELPRGFRYGVPRSLARDGREETGHGAPQHHRHRRARARPDTRTVRFARHRSRHKGWLPATIACVGAAFASLGRFAVRFRWAVIAAWLAGTVAAMTLLPGLGSVTQSDNSSFLPASAPSQQAATLAAPIQGAASLTAVTIVAARPSGLTTADEAAAARLGARLAQVTHVVAVQSAGVSADGDATRLTVLAAIPQAPGLSASSQAALCAALRAAMGGVLLPAGLRAHLARAVATRVDNNAVSTSSGSKVQWFSLIFVVALLVAVFRSALAPFVAVVPAALVVLVSERLTAVAAIHLGLGISQI